MSTTKVITPASPASPVSSVTTPAVTSPLVPAPTARGHNLQIQTRPPVDQDGAFHQDKVIKSGWLLKKTRKTKGWKRRWFVLRADRLSCYKDQKEYKIHRQIYLADVTAVAALKDAKQPHSFGIFSQSKNFHFRAESEEETNDWTEKIWGAVAKEVPEQEMLLSSPITPAHFSSIPHDSRLVSPTDTSLQAHAKVLGGRRTSAQTLDYSGPDVGSVSSLSDIARVSQLSLSYNETGFVPGTDVPDRRLSGEPPRITRNGSGFSSTEQLPRVIWHGYLYCLKSKGGVKQWKKYWVVVRNINIAFYKNEEEYRAIKILPLESIVDAVEIDPASKSKKHCLQIITEAKAYRLAAPDEEILVKSLGAMKSALAKSKVPPVPPVPIAAVPAQAQVPGH